LKIAAGLPSDLLLQVHDLRNGFLGTEQLADFAAVFQWQKTAPFLGLEMGVSVSMDGLIENPKIKWMIWGSHHFGNLQIW